MGVAVWMLAAVGCAVRAGLGLARIAGARCGAGVRVGAGVADGATLGNVLAGASVGP